MSKSADRVWNGLVALVMDTRQDWRRRVVEATGLPFGRVRALKRLYDGPLALHELAEAMTVDAPAATVAVNDLVKRGLVARKPHPTNGRLKLVSLTPKGREVVARVKAVTEEAPPAFASLSSAELAALERVLSQMTR
ncbi:MAG TPA: MarR family transcriptional regulator [Polyangiaceae bacterium]|jgi:DNA-binding MarR family transcriptional regulator|nr:MarR family transcriptional regulator [Polyangiaceae bacterium]